MKIDKKDYGIKLFLLEAGHGDVIDGVYQTSGKRSPVWPDGSQYFEGVGNRLIRDEIAKLMKKEGLRFKFINEGQKDMSLQQRVDIANSYFRKYGVNNCLFNSIHSDGFDNPDANGWTCYTSRGQTRSDIYATALYKEMEKVFPNEYFRKSLGDGDPDKEAGFKVLTDTLGPAIMSENFYMTNFKNCKDILMVKSEVRKIAKAHVDMYLKFAV